MPARKYKRGAATSGVRFQTSSVCDYSQIFRPFLTKVCCRCPKHWNVDDADNSLQFALPWHHFSAISSKSYECVLVSWKLHKYKLRAWQWTGCKTWNVSFIFLDSIEVLRGKCSGGEIRGHYKRLSRGPGWGGVDWLTGDGRRQNCGNLATKEGNLAGQLGNLGQWWLSCQSSDQNQCEVQFGVKGGIHPHVWALTGGALDNEECMNTSIAIKRSGLWQPFW